MIFIQHLFTANLTHFDALHFISGFKLNSNSNLIVYYVSMYSQVHNFQSKSVLMTFLQLISLEERCILVETIF